MHTLASSSEDGLKTWTYGAPGSSLSASAIAPRSQLRGGAGGAAQCARFNHNGQVLVGAGAAGVITLWHTNGTVLGELARDKDRGKPIRALYFSSGSRYLATGGTDRVVKIWDLKRREVIRSFKAHTTAVTCVQFSKDADKFVASGAVSGKVCLFNVLSGRLVNTLDPPHASSLSKSSDRGVHAVSFSPFRKSILAAAYGDGCVRTWDVSIGASSSSKNTSNPSSTGTTTSKRSLLHTFSSTHAEASGVSAVSYSPIDPNTLMSAGYDKTIRLYDTKLASLAGTLEADTALSCASFFPDGRRIVAGTVRGELLVFDSRKLGSSVHPVARVTAHGRHVVASVQVQPGGSGGGGRESGRKSRAKNSMNNTGGELLAAGKSQGSSSVRTSVSSVHSIADPSISSMRSSRSSAVSIVSSSSSNMRNGGRLPISDDSSPASSVSHLPESVSVFSAVKKPQPQTKQPRQPSIMVKPAKIELSTEIPPVRRAIPENENIGSSMSGKTAPEEATSDRMSAVTASTISLEEQIRNLLGDPSKASSATVPASTSTSKSASSSIMASKESAETKQESHAARGLTTNSVVNVSERGLDSQVTSSRGQANTPTFV